MADPAAVLKFLEPFARVSPDSSEHLPDGSTVIFTLKDENAADLTSMILRESALTYVVRRDVAIGQTVYNERPLGCVSVLDKGKGHVLLPPDHVTVEELFRRAGKALKRVHASLEWLVTSVLAAVPDQAKRIVTQMPQPGKYSLCRVLLHMVEEKTPLPEDIRAWIAHILRVSGGKLNIAEIILLYGSVCRNSMQLQSPLTGSMYGIAVYPGAAHVSTSCTPNVRPLFTEGGIVQLVAMEEMPAGTEITIGRGGPVFSPFFRCIQTGPAWIRSMADNTSGVRCTCKECKVTIAWLRQSAGAEGDAQMSDETVQKIVTIVNDTWKGSDDKQPWSYHADVADILAFPLRLPHVSEFAELATMVPAGTIEAFCRLGALRSPKPPGSRAFGPWICHLL